MKFTFDMYEEMAGVANEIRECLERNLLPLAFELATPIISQKDLTLDDGKEVRVSVVAVRVMGPPDQKDVNDYKYWVIITDKNSGEILAKVAIYDDDVDGTLERIGIMEHKGKVYVFPLYNEKEQYELKFYFVGDDGKLKENAYKIYVENYPSAVPKK